MTERRSVLSASLLGLAAASPAAAQAEAKPLAGKDPRSGACFGWPASLGLPSHA